MPFPHPFALVAVLACAACSPPGDPPGEGPPEPQVAAPARDAMRAPIDAARAVEGAVRDAADLQRARIEATAQ